MLHASSLDDLPPPPSFPLELPIVSALDDLVALGAQPTTDTHGDGVPVIHGLYPSPDRNRVMVQMSASKSWAYVINLTNRGRPTLTRLTSLGWGEFLAWHPDSQHVLFKAVTEDVADPGLWLVNTEDGSHRRIDIPNLVVPTGAAVVALGPNQIVPEGIVAASIAPDGQTIAYSTTRGLGFGSELWLCDINGGNQRQVQSIPMAVMASLQWSPDGGQLAYNTLEDSPVPFAPAALWVVGRDGATPRRMALMDGGHGQQPLWSGDSQRLYFVARENPNDRRADREAEALVSSIRAVDVQAARESVVVPANGARQVDLSLADDGTLRFVSNRAGTLEVWGATPGGQLRQLTANGTAKRHPVQLR
jgi:Tol biopolymer transport system component